MSDEAERITEQALASLEGAPEPRLAALVEGLVRHLHAFVREVRPSPAEWLAAMHFLTEAGKRDEFILLSDVLGVSSLVETLADEGAGGTPRNVLGPFWREGAPLMTSPARIYEGEIEAPLVLSGHVRDETGRALPGALLDVWQTAPNGLYDCQDDSQPAFNFRARVEADPHGGYAIETALPVSYRIPQEGPVGALMRALARPCWRPAHIHVRVSAPGCVPLTTMLFIAGDSHLAGDCIFAVRDGLVIAPAACAPADESRAGRRPRLFRARYDFRLAPDAASRPALQAQGAPRAP